MLSDTVIDLLQGLPRTLQVTSASFQHGKRIPREHTCKGDDTSPAVRVEGVPPEARSLALCMEDPDTTTGTFTHWVAWDLPVGLDLPEGADLAALGAKEGLTDFGRAGYTGPCPPSGTHRYFLRAFALSEPLGLPPGSEAVEVRSAMEGRILAWGELMGTFTA